MATHREVADSFIANSLYHRNGSRMFWKECTNGRAIYSYGEHYALAAILTTDNGTEIYLGNSTYYSRSTARHHNIVLSAGSSYGAPIPVPVVIPRGLYDHHTNMAYYCDLIRKEITQLNAMPPRNLAIEMRFARGRVTVLTSRGARYARAFDLDATALWEAREAFRALRCRENIADAMHLLQKYLPKAYRKAMRATTGMPAIERCQWVVTHMADELTTARVVERLT